MEEELVTYQIALKLKEKGFDIPCEMYYHIHDDIEDSIMSLESTGGWCNFYNSKNRYRCAAPDIPQVLKWLRKEKSIYVAPCFVYDTDADCRIINRSTFWSFYIQIIEAGDIIYSEVGRRFDSYEEASLAGIEYVLDNNFI